MVELRRSAVPVLVAGVVFGGVLPAFTQPGRVLDAGPGQLGSAKVNGVATSMDGETIYVTVTGILPGRSAEGGLLELPAFGGAR